MFSLNLGLFVTVFVKAVGLDEILVGSTQTPSLGSKLAVQVNAELV